MKGMLLQNTFHLKSSNRMANLYPSSLKIPYERKKKIENKRTFTVDCTTLQCRPAFSTSCSHWYQNCNVHNITSAKKTVKAFLVCGVAGGGEGGGCLFLGVQKQIYKRGTYAFTFLCDKQEGNFCLICLL